MNENWRLGRLTLLKKKSGSRFLAAELLVAPARGPAEGPTRLPGVITIFP
jgi:hypothetical protein